MTTKYLFAAMEVTTGSSLRKLILINLCDRANKKGQAWPSINRIARECECGRTAVIRHLAELERLGFISKERRSEDNLNITNMYSIHLSARAELKKKPETPKKQEEGGISEVLGGISETPPPSISEVLGVVSQKHQGGISETPKPPKEPPNEPKERKTSVFAPPTVDEVQEYLDAKNITSFTAEAFVDYYEACGWTRGKTKIKNWKSCVRTWTHNDRSSKEVPAQNIGGR